MSNHTSKRKENLDRFVGKHFLYTYENGWQYEMYIRNANTIDYRIHSGIVGGRWVNKQKAYIHQIAEHVFKFSWDEPTGTFVSLTVNLEVPILHGTVAFPRWVIEHPEKTVCHQNDFLDLIVQYRDAGPTYEKTIEDNFATITFMRDAGSDNDEVIACPPSELPKDYPNNLRNWGCK